MNLDPKLLVIWTKSPNKHNRDLIHFVFYVFHMLESSSPRAERVIVDMVKLVNKLGQIELEFSLKV